MPRANAASNALECLCGAGLRSTPPGRGASGKTMAFFLLTPPSRRFTRTCSTTRVKRSSLSRGGRENRLRTVADRPARFDWSGLREDGQSRPRCAADEDRTDASEDLPPNERRHPDLRHRKNNMIASKCRRQSKHRRNDGTQDQRPSQGERDLSDRKGHAAGGDGN